MKVLIIILLLLSSTLSFAKDNRYSLEVDGLACPFCAYGIEKKLNSVDGVESVEIDIDKGRVIVTIVHDTVLDKSVASNAVDDAGFTLRSMMKLPDEI